MQLRDENIHTHTHTPYTGPLIPIYTFKHLVELLEGRSGLSVVDVCEPNIVTTQELPVLISSLRNKSYYYYI